MKNFLKKNWRIYFLFYVLLYLPWFFYVERTITATSPNLHIMHCALDDLIPFCEYFVIPYLLWFLYMVVSCIYVYFKGTNVEYLRLAFSLIIGMSFALLFYMIFPNGHDLRPTVLPNDNFFTPIISALYATDTSTNVFPSVHVYNSLVVHISLAKLKALDNHKWIRHASLILCVLICLSTVFLKQHSALDVAGAIVLVAVVYVLTYVVDYKKLFSKKKENKEILE